MGQCLRTLGISSSEPYDELQNSNLPIVTLDKRWKGKDVTISNFTVAGKGIALCTAAIHQSRAYYEVTIKKDGDICIGVSQRSKKLNGHLGDIKRKSWGVRSNGRFKEDDVIAKVSCTRINSYTDTLLGIKTGSLIVALAARISLIACFSWSFSSSDKRADSLDVYTSRSTLFNACGAS